MLWSRNRHHAEVLWKSRRFPPKEKTTMIRTVFAMAVAALVLAAVSGTSQAAPIAPLSAVVTGGQGDVTQVYWHRGWHGGWHRGWHRGWRHCWWHRGYRVCGW